MKIKSTLLQAVLFVSCLLLSLNTTAQSIEQQVDAILNAQYNHNGPGATALIYKNGEVIYRKGFGYANIELDVKMQPEHVFEIGSITKQFTAIAILMLEEQGKLKIEDDITKFIPDYPTLGKTITIHHLLNHTSGIKSYTGMKSFREKARLDMTPVELIDVFKNEPMDFDPGEQYRYNNSGYIILGHIIELVTGVSYEDFVQQNFFDKLGMTNSYYGSHQRLIKNRAYGYQDRDGYVNADYLSMTLPYAAGSLMSNVDDLLKWQKALNTNQLISKATYEKAINGSLLNNREPIGYGYGLQSGKIQGSKIISHGGGIFGYTTQGIYLPKEDVFVSILTNCDCNSPGRYATKIAAIAIGKPFPDVKDAITLSDAELKKWTGAYEFSDGAVRFITVENGKIFSQRENSTQFEIFPLSPTRFIFEEGSIEYNFSLVNGKKQAVFKTGEEMIGKEIDKALPTAKKEMTLSKNELKEYIGKYQLAPEFAIEISVKDGKIFAQATGQGANEIFAESKDKFFLKVVAAELVFSRDKNGKVHQLNLHQSGRVLSGKKVN
ncbi:MAG: serine hydrolase [Flavobacteriaceae bacterium]|nr:serine hydrolase [Flavobacteriaceae bacterium]